MDREGAMSFAKKSTLKWIALFILLLLPFMVVMSVMLAIAAFLAVLAVVDAVLAASPILSENVGLFGSSILAGTFILLSAYLKVIMRSVLAGDFTETAYSWTLAVLAFIVLCVLVRVGIIADHAVSAAGFRWEGSGGMVHVVVQATYLLVTEIVFLPFVWRSEMFNPRLAHG
jgi:hypothetical protein